jgi:hypothetical protein
MAEVTVSGNVLLRYECGVQKVSRKYLFRGYSEPFSGL